MAKKVTIGLFLFGVVCFIIALMQPANADQTSLLAWVLSIGVLLGVCAGFVALGGGIETAIRRRKESDDERHSGHELEGVQQQLDHGDNSLQELLDIQAQLARMDDIPGVEKARAQASRAITDIKLVGLRERLNPLADDARARREAQDEILSGDARTSDIELELAKGRKRTGGLLGLLRDQARRLE